MKICNVDYKIINELETLNVQDCFVLGMHKIGDGNGERKYYISSKKSMNVFFHWDQDGNKDDEQQAECFFLKSDIEQYLKVMDSEFRKPRLPYNDKSKKFLKKENFNEELSKLANDELLRFTIHPRNKLKGERGYVESIVPSTTNRKDFAKWDKYDQIRKFLLPILTSIQIYELVDVNTNKIIYYWRPYPDFESFANLNRLLVLYYSNPNSNKKLTKEEKEERIAKYRKKATAIESNRRTGQTKYRDELIEEFQECPITHISERTLLIASHIKPWAICEDNKTKYNKYNGFLFSPLIDKLFDKGYITISSKGKIVISALLNENDKAQINLDTENVVIQEKYLNARKDFLEYHHKYVFRGEYKE